MYAAAVKSTEGNKIKANASNVGGRRRGIRRGFGFVYNRPESKKLRTMQLMNGNGGGQQQQQPQPQVVIVRNWHYGFEVWAYQAGIVDPQGRLGFVPHYNIRVGNGPEQHVYINAYGQLEIVPLGGRPNGY